MLLLAKLCLIFMPVAFLDPHSQTDLSTCQWAIVEDEEEQENLLGLGSSLSKMLTTDATVPGKLLGCHEVYDRLGASSYIVETVRLGYRLVLDSIPPSSFTSNNKSALKMSEFVWEELCRLETLKCISRVKERPTVVMPLSAVFSKKWRLVLDASRHVNPYCTKRSIKLEDLNTVAKLVKQGDFMVSNDLDSGYWHVPIHVEDRHMLGVHFVHEDQSVTYFVWNVLALGLRDAAHIFTKLIKPIMGELRRRGFRCSIYIDDKLTLHQDYFMCLQQEEQEKILFEEGGWVFKASKRSGNPAQQVVHLGLIIDSVKMVFAIPEEKKDKVKKLAKEMLIRKRFKVKELASFVGLLQSLRLATGPIISVFCRSSYSCIAKAKSWFSDVRLSHEVKAELNWWLSNLEDVSSYPIRQSSTGSVVSFSTAGDASDKGFFTYEVDSKEKLATRSFTEEEARKSSTFRELVALRDTWCDISIVSKYKNMRVRHLTDNKAVTFILKSGSKKPELQKLVVDIVLSCRDYNVALEVEWLSRDDPVIEFADLGSRGFFEDDVELDHDTMNEVDNIFGPFNCDAFASAANTKCELFFSRGNVPGSSGIDFFLQSLDPGVNHWIFPPVKHLIGVIWHLDRFKAHGALVLPVWPQSAFYIEFFPDGIHLANFVQDVFWCKPFFLVPNHVGGGALRGRKKFWTAVVRVDFSEVPYEESRTSKLSSSHCYKGGCLACEEQ